MVSTSERLAQVLEAEGLPDMAARARNLYYDEYWSPLATPIAQLVLDLYSVKRGDLARRAMSLEWIGTKEEGETWYRLNKR